MRAACVPADEQFRLIMECHAGGLMPTNGVCRTTSVPVVFITGESVFVRMNVWKFQKL